MPAIKSVGNVDACPVTKETWESRAELKKADCGGGTLYHCLTDNNGTKWEKCVEKTLIGKGHCPVFTSDGYINWKSCNISEASCPNSSYVSNEVYKYPLCFGDNTPTNKTSNDSSDHGRDGPSLGLIIGIVAPIVLLILATVLICKALGFWRRQKARDKIWKNISEMNPLLQGKDERGMKYSKNIAEMIVSELKKESVNCILVTGDMDHFMVSTARDVLQTCAKDLNKTPKEYLFPEIPSTFKENTLIFIYGWFGLFNDDLCSLDTAKDVCVTLEKYCTSKSNVKFAIGMRRDIYSKYKENLKKFSPKVFACKHIELKQSDLNQEYGTFYEEVNSKVKKQTDRDLNREKLMNDQHGNVIGMALKVEIISSYYQDPPFINSFIENYDILTAVKVHLTGLETTDIAIYQWVMYICLKGYFSRYESFDKGLVKNVKFKIKPSMFDEHFEKLKQYVRIWYQNPNKDAKYVFWHPFIYICAFHSLFERHKDIVMNHCHVDAILQLVRPKSMTTSSVEVAADDSDIKTFKNRLLKLGLTNKYKDHPLVRDEVQHT